MTGEKETLDEEKLQLRLLIKHASGGARAEISKRFEPRQKELRARLLDGLRAEFPSWTRSLNHALENYEAWLEETLTRELQALSVAERTAIIRPVEQTSKQVLRALQNFRDRLSERSLRAFGVPLRTTEVEIEIAEPKAMRLNSAPTSSASAGAAKISHGWH